MPFKNNLVVSFFLIGYITFDQHMLFFSEFINEFSLTWYSTLKALMNKWT